MTLILASGSATRQQMLRQAGVPFTAHPADLDETGLMAAMAGAEAAAVAPALAEAKARAVAARYPGQPVLGADTVVELDGRIISKCADLAAARALLLAMRGKTHRLISAACLVRDNAVLWQRASLVTLTVRDFSEAFLDAYLAAEGEALLASVGCYRFEGLGSQLFDNVEGDFFSVLGLSLLPVLTALRAHAILAA